jgi:hypothetical protein
MLNFKRKPTKVQKTFSMYMVVSYRLWFPRINQREPVDFQFLLFSRLIDI